MEPKGKPVQPLREEGDCPLMYKPDTGEYVQVHDARGSEPQEAAAHPPSDEEKRAFYAHRLAWIRSQGLPADRERELIDQVLSGLSREETAAAFQAADGEPPVPGGVGWGVIYNEGQLLFTSYSALYQYITTPAAVGGGSDTWFYLTATNRASKGVEAFVSYYKQDRPIFKVFDWAKEGDARWAYELDSSLWGDYRITYSVDGQDYETLYVANWTRLLGGTTWRNDVLLYNRNTGAYDLRYRYDYTLASNSEQKPQFWGPIVETFQKYPLDTNVVGFFEASLWQDSGGFKLTPENTHIRRDDDSFQVVFLDPNSSFLVH